MTNKTAIISLGEYSKKIPYSSKLMEEWISIFALDSKTEFIRICEDELISEIRKHIKVMIDGVDIKNE